jgi:hypothetical protein
MKREPTAEEWGNIVRAIAAGDRTERLACLLYYPSEA